MKPKGPNANNSRDLVKRLPATHASQPKTPNHTQHHPILPLSSKGIPHPPPRLQYRRHLLLPLNRPLTNQLLPTMRTQHPISKSAHFRFQSLGSGNAALALPARERALVIRGWEGVGFRSRFAGRYGPGGRGIPVGVGGVYLGLWGWGTRAGLVMWTLGFGCVGIVSCGVRGQGFAFLFSGKSTGVSATSQTFLLRGDSECTDAWMYQPVWQLRHTSDSPADQRFSTSAKVVAIGVARMGVVVMAARSRSERVKCMLCLVCGL